MKVVLTLYELNRLKLYLSSLTKEEMTTLLKEIGHK